MAALTTATRTRAFSPFLRPDRLGHLAARLLDARARGAAETMRARGIAERLVGEIGQHRLQHLGADRGGGGMVEVDDGTRHGWIIRGPGMGLKSGPSEGGEGAKV